MDRNAHIQDAARRLVRRLKRAGLRHQTLSPDPWPAVIDEIAGVISEEIVRDRLARKSEAGKDSTNA